jgi:2-hydroxychromene-2-carboxylate isomerase
VNEHTTNVDWYFDFISPFAYLQSAKLEELSRRAIS